ncbi:MAG: TorF family putative porin [Phenylobacterium sp.]|uniref:TorF family putative porin n=1 Tax=Phenylobacterium sp. TaxID=1871053 RepID=UPI003919DCE0
MKSVKIALLAAAATVAMGGAAFAQDEGPSVSFNIGAASDYVFRGVSQTDENAQIYGGADLSSGIFYAGVWASNVDFGDSTDAEVDAYVGITPTAGPVSLDFAAIYYGYVNAPSGSNYGYWEFKAAGSVPAGPAEIGAAMYYSPEFFGETGEALYYEVNASTSLTDKISVSGAIGHQDVDQGIDYNTWNLGVGLAVNDHIGFDLRYHDTDEEDLLGEIGEGRVVLGVKASF